MCSERINGESEFRLCKEEKAGVTRLLTDLIFIESANTGRKRANRAGAEAEVADYVEKFLGNLGMETERKYVHKGRPNIIGFRRGKGSGKSLALECHMDTVGVEGMTIEPFGGRIEDGRMYGRGSCDAKGSMAAMLFALKLLFVKGIEIDTDVYFVGAVDEETGCAGSRELIRSGFKVDAAIVGEPTGLDVVISHKGGVWWKVKVRGKSAHGSNPGIGKNAIYQMSRIIQLIEEDVVANLKRSSHPLLGHPTINVGTIRGGEKINVVPNLCEIEIDRRTLPGEDPDDIIREFVEQVGDLRDGGDELSVDIEDVECHLALETDPEARIVKVLKSCVAGRVGKSELKGVSYFSDAGPFSSAGISSVVFGPGDIEQAHTDDEYVELEQVFRATEIIAEAVMKF